MKELIRTSSQEVQLLRNRDRRLAKVVLSIGDIKYEVQQDYYSFLVTTIVGQQLSNKVAGIINQRLVDACVGVITPEKISLINDEIFREIGVGKNKVKYIKGLTNEVLKSPKYWDKIESISNQEVINKLTILSGIGNWTVKMFLIFALDRKDVLPYEDIAFLQSYKWLYKTNDVSPESVLKRCEKWQPYASIAARYMYKALDGGLTKTEFHLYKS